MHHWQGHVELRSFPLHCNPLLAFVKGSKALGVAQIGKKAYLLWESNGRPEGGDFSSQARKELESQLRAGLSLEEVERSLTGVSSTLSSSRRCPST